MIASEILKEVRKIEITTGRLVSETFAGEYQSVFKGRGMEFAEVREYIPGDDIRSIDWNVTARLGRPFIKRYMEERELTMMLACDISGSQFFGTREKFKSEITIQLAALFAFSALQNNDKVGMALFTDRMERFIPPRKGRRHVLRLISELLSGRPSSAGTDIDLCLDTLNKVLRRQSILIFLSDFMSENFEHSFRLAAKKFDVIPVLIEDPAESRLPGASVVMDVEDPETGSHAVWDISSPRFLAEYKKRHSERIERARDLFKSVGVEWIRITSGASVVNPVMRFFRERAKRFH